MENVLETLFHSKKSEILNSKFRNTLYNNQTMSEYFGEKPVKNAKEAPSLMGLLEMFVFPKIPTFNDEDFIKFRSVYEKYPHLYLRYGNKLIYLANIQDLCAHFDQYADQQETPVGFYLPSFFSRSHKIVFLNNITGERRTEQYPTEKNGKRSHEADRIFLHLFYSNKSNAAILEALQWSDYEALKAELKTAKRFDRQKAIVERILTEDADLLKRLSQ